ncbi:hypothetical protein DFH27DRAFT_562816 [Peziza echinospora]|nr:hypothetical protein DFH27DRAFT_562816 [Peziza echinospora]
MSSYNKKNPSHGQKVSRDPRSHTDLKHEYAGPIAADSLAAESLRSGGLFAQGNPADILSVKGAHGTFASHPEATGLHFQEIHPGKKRGDEDVFETGKPGGIDEDFKLKSAWVGILLGANDPIEPPRPTDKKGNYIKRSVWRQMEAERQAAEKAGKEGAEAVSDKKDEHPKAEAERLAAQKAGKEGAEAVSEKKDEHPKLSLRGGGAEDESKKIGGSGHQGLSASKYAPSTTSHKTGTVGNDAVKNKEEPDWSKVSKDTNSNPDIGGADDPSRDAAAQLARASTREVGQSVHDKEDRKNPYQQLNADESV